MICRALPLLVVALACTANRAGSAEELFFDSNGVKIHYTDEGKGEPVLLIHGFIADITINWTIPGTRKALAQAGWMREADLAGDTFADALKKR